MNSKIEFNNPCRKSKSKKGHLKLNHKNENRILAYGFATGILVLGIGTSAIILNHEIQNANRATNFNSKNYLVFRQENLDSTFNFQVLDWETAQENQPQNLKTKTEIQNPAFLLSDQDRYTICCIVAGEAKGESMEGKMAVATCLRNAMAKDQISASQARTKYKYSGWDSDLEQSNPDCWAEVCEAVSRVFDDGESVTENPILFFYAPKRIAGKWHKTLPHDQIIGNHSFHYLDEDVNADWFLNLKGVD